MSEHGDDDTAQPHDGASSQSESNDRFGGVRFAFLLLAVLVAVGVWQFVTNGFDDVDPDTGEPIVDVDETDG